MIVANVMELTTKFHISYKNIIIILLYLKKLGVLFNISSALCKNNET